MAPIFIYLNAKDFFQEYFFMFTIYAVVNPKHTNHKIYPLPPPIIFCKAAKIIKGISNLSVFGTVTNVFTITGYSWFDPDVNAFGSDASRRGVDIFSYPSSRTYSIGFKLTL